MTAFDPIRYIGSVTANADYTDGRLRPALGTYTVQAVRCDASAEGGIRAWTYNHAPMLARFGEVLLLSYLSNPAGEHVAPGRTLLCWSRDDLSFGEPVILFPEYAVPDGVFAYQGKPLASATYAVMHQRMGFYEAKNGRMLALGNYGISPDGETVPFGALSIGRVVREVYTDLSLGPIYFIRYTVGTVWSEENTRYPLYAQSLDEGFRQACEELLGDPLVTQQWAEEQGDADPLITLKAKDCGTLYNKAFSYYRLPNGDVIGLWKWMRCARSGDGGRHWSGQKATDRIWHAGGKIWGQRTSDGRYALVYTPHTQNARRWPLAIVTGDDGETFDNMRLVAGDLGPLRYAGNHKSRGFHYARGIENRGGESPDGALYVAYSVNKEDIWVARVPVPVADTEETDIHEQYADALPLPFIPRWNAHVPTGTSVRIEKPSFAAANCLMIASRGAHDTVKATRLFKPGCEVTATVTFAVTGDGQLQLELVSDEGDAPIRFVIRPGGKTLCVTHGRKTEEAVAAFETGTFHTLSIVADTARQVFSATLDRMPLGGGQTYQGQRADMAGWYFAAPAAMLSRLSFRIGEDRRFFTCHQGKPMGEPADCGMAAAFFIQSVSIASRR